MKNQKSKSELLRESFIKDPADHWEYKAAIIGIYGSEMKSIYEGPWKTCQRYHKMIKEAFRGKILNYELHDHSIK